MIRQEIQRISDHLKSQRSFFDRKKEITFDELTIAFNLLLKRLDQLEAIFVIIGQFIEEGKISNSQLSKIYSQEIGQKSLLDPEIQERYFKKIKQDIHDCEGKQNLKKLTHGFEDLEPVIKAFAEKSDYKAVTDGLMPLEKWEFSYEFAITPFLEKIKKRIDELTPLLHPHFHIFRAAEGLVANYPSNAEIKTHKEKPDYTLLLDGKEYPFSRQVLNKQLHLAEKWEGNQLDFNALCQDLFPDHLFNEQTPDKVCEIALNFLYEEKYSQTLHCNGQVIPLCKLSHEELCALIHLADFLGYGHLSYLAELAFLEAVEKTFDEYFNILQGKSEKSYLDCCQEELLFRRILPQIGMSQAGRLEFAHLDKKRKSKRPYFPECSMGRWIDLPLYARPYKFLIAFDKKLENYPTKEELALHKSQPNCFLIIGEDKYPFCRQALDKQLPWPEMFNGNELDCLEFVKIMTNRKQSKKFADESIELSEDEDLNVKLDSYDFKNIPLLKIITEYLYEEKYSTACIEKIKQLKLYEIYSLIQFTHFLQFHHLQFMAEKVLLEYIEVIIPEDLFISHIRDYDLKRMPKKSKVSEESRKIISKIAEERSLRARRNRTKAGHLDSKTSSNEFSEMCDKMHKKMIFQPYFEKENSETNDR